LPAATESAAMGQVATALSQIDGPPQIPARGGEGRRRPARRA